MNSLFKIRSHQVKTKLLTTLACAGLLSVSVVYAGGRPVGKKRLYINISASYFYNNKFWDQSGQTQSYDFNGHNTSLSASLSAEYGFSRRVSLTVGVPYVFNSIKNDLYTSTFNSFGDAQIGLRYYLANISYRTYFSVQGNLIVPLYTNTATVTHGYGQAGAGLTLAAAGDFKMFDKGFFFEADLGSNQYFGADAPFQGRFTGSLGFSVTEKCQFSASETMIRSYSLSKTFNPLSTSPARDFSSNQITGTLSQSLGRGRSLSLTYGTFISGTNTAIGSSISLGYGFKY